MKPRKRIEAEYRKYMEGRECELREKAWSEMIKQYGLPDPWTDYSILSEPPSVVVTGTNPYEGVITIEPLRLQERKPEDKKASPIKRAEQVSVSAEELAKQTKDALELYRRLRA